jgi:hypothetical protein
MGSFNPLGAESGILSTVAPTVLKPIVQLEGNKTWYGGPIRPEVNSWGVPRPNNELYYEGRVYPWSKKITKTLFNWTGGRQEWLMKNDKKFWESPIDISPADIDHIVDFIGGGAGKSITRTAKTAAHAISGDIPPLEGVPGLRRFVGIHKPYVDAGTYYGNKQHLKLIQHEIKDREESDPRYAGKVERQYAPLLDIVPDLDDIAKEIKLLVQDQAVAMTKGQRKRLQGQIDRQILEYNRLFKKAMGKSKRRYSKSN